jgi:D-sedoheptulose 7-phosphate isomerase
MEQVITDLFSQSIQAKIDHSESLVKPLLDAASLITNSLLQEGKLLICADGISEPIGHTLVYYMMNGNRLERPGLPALMLRPTVGQNSPDNDLYSGQIRTISNQSDTLIVISPGTVTRQLMDAIASAQQCKLKVVALTAPGHEPLSEILLPSDAELFADNEDQYCIQEIHMRAIFCLCELVENNLFGALN